MELDDPFIVVSGSDEEGELDLPHIALGLDNAVDNDTASVASSSHASTASRAETVDLGSDDLADDGIQLQMPRMSTYSDSESGSPLRCISEPADNVNDSDIHHILDDDELDDSCYSVTTVRHSTTFACHDRFGTNAFDVLLGSPIPLLYALLVLSLSYLILSRTMPSHVSDSLSSSPGSANPFCHVVSSICQVHVRDEPNACNCGGDVRSGSIGHAVSTPDMSRPNATHALATLGLPLFDCFPATLPAVLGNALVGLTNLSIIPSHARRLKPELQDVLHRAQTNVRRIRPKLHKVVRRAGANARRVKPELDQALRKARSNIHHIKPELRRSVLLARHNACRLRDRAASRAAGQVRRARGVLQMYLVSKPEAGSE